MTAIQLGKGLPNRLPNRPPLPNPVRQLAEVRQIACLTKNALLTPINKGVQRVVRQLGKLGTNSHISMKEGGRDGSLPNLPNQSKSDPNSPARPAHQKGPTP